MIKFSKPANLNGFELINELQAAKIKISEPPMIDGNGDFWLNINAKDESKAQDVVASHDGTTISPDLSARRQDILDRLGITADEAKLLLG